MKRFLQDFFLSFHYKKQLKRLVKRKIKQVAEIKTIGVLWGVDMAIDQTLIDKLASLLEVSKQKIQIVVPTAAGKMDDSKGLKIQYVDQKFLSWSAQFTSKENRFCNTSFDLLINYFDQPSKLTALLSAQSKAKFRVGFAQADHRLNDLVFDFKPTEQQLFFEEFSKYIKTLFNKDS